nr:MAG TPA: hypothetical protein [Caudoviricetes sp.]
MQKEQAVQKHPRQSKPVQKVKRALLSPLFSSSYFEYFTLWRLNYQLLLVRLQ